MVFTHRKALVFNCTRKIKHADECTFCMRALFNTSSIRVLAINLLKREQKPGVAAL